MGRHFQPFVEVTGATYCMFLDFFSILASYSYAKRDNKLEEFHVEWKDLQELMQSERRRTRRTLYTEADTLIHYGKIKCNGLLC